MSFFPAIRLCNFRFIIKGGNSVHFLPTNFLLLFDLVQIRVYRTEGNLILPIFLEELFLACDFAIFGHTIFAGELFAALLFFRLGSSRQGEILSIFLGQAFAAFGVCRFTTNLASRIFAASGFCIWPKLGVLVSTKVTEVLCLWGWW